MPDSSKFSGFVNVKDPLPPGKSFSKTSSKFTEIVLNEFSILNLISSSISLIYFKSYFLVVFNSSMFVDISSYLVFKDSKSSEAK